MTMVKNAQGFLSSGLLVVVFSAMQSIIIVKFVTNPHEPRQTWMYYLVYGDIE